MLIRTVETSLLSVLQWLPSRQTQRCLRRAIHAPFLVHWRGLSLHSYADDTQLYLSFPPQSLVNCLHEIKVWMSFNLLRLNSNKTVLIVVAPNAFLQKVGDRFLDFWRLFYLPIPGNSQPGCHPGHTHFWHILSTDTKSAFSHLSKTSLDFSHNFSNSGANTYFLAFVTAARITAIEFCLGLPAKTLTSLSMSRIQLPGSLHQHITPTLIYLRLHHASPKKKKKTSSLILVRPPPSTQIVPDSQMLWSSERGPRHQLPHFWGHCLQCCCFHSLELSPIRAPHCLISGQL